MIDEKIAIFKNDVGHGERYIDQKDKQAGYVDAVYVPQNDHYHVGTITVRKNQS